MVVLLASFSLFGSGILVEKEWQQKKDGRGLRATPILLFHDVLLVSTS
jgi:hypothetical protein